MSHARHTWTSVDSAGVLICLVLTVGAGWIGAGPIWQRHANLLQQQRDLQAKRLDNAQQASALKTTQRRLGVVKIQLDKLPLRLEQTTQLNRRLAAVTDLAGKSKLKIEDIEPGKASRGVRYDSVSIELAGEGTYASCATFLHQLKQTMPDMGIRALHVNWEGHSESTASFKFELDWFAAPTPDVAAAQ